MSGMVTMKVWSRPTVYSIFQFALVGKHKKVSLINVDKPLDYRRALNEQENNSTNNNIIIIILSPQCKARREREHSISPKKTNPHTTNPWKEEKDKTVGDKKERADHSNRKAMALLLKTASPTPPNTVTKIVPKRHR